MKHFGMLVLAGGLLLTLPALAADRAAPSAARGKQLFLKVGCWECHGTVGQGTAAGLKLAPDPLPVDALTTFVHTTTGQMPAYKPQNLTDADLADIHAYLASIPKSAAPDSVPALKGLKDHD